MQLWIELIVAVVIFVFVIGSAVIFLRGVHAGGEPGRVLLGAAMTGAIIGAIIGFAIVPLRFALMANGAASDPRLGPTVLVAVVALIAFRRGLAARLPLIGGPIRAYRKAGLRYAIDLSQKRLERLERIDAGAGATDRSA